MVVGFVQKLRELFGLDIREDNDLEVFCKNNYEAIPVPAYTNKRKVSGQSYPVFLNELITPKAWKIAQLKQGLLLDSDRFKRVRSVGNVVAKKLLWTDDKNLDNSGDYYLYPAETLTLLKGDCEDHSFVMASALPDDLGVAYGVWDNGKLKYGHAFNVFAYNNELWVLDTVGDAVVTQKVTDSSPYKIYYVVTNNYCFQVKKGIEFGELAGWNS